MEIDFLGLNSPNCKLEQDKSKNPYIDAGGGVEISLSLSTSSSLDFSEKKKWEFSPCENIISSCSGSSVCSLPSYSQEKTEQLPSTLLLVPPPFFRRSAGGGFLYDLNDAAATVNLRKLNRTKFCLCRNMSQLSIQPPASLAMFYPTCPNVFTETEKVDQNRVYISGNASTGGHTPTIAMARKASLARFLEKRLHRMNQARASHVIGRSPNSESCENKNNKRNNNLKRKS